MTKTAQIILTGYDKTKITQSVSKIKRYTKENGIHLDLNPPEEGQIKPQSMLWGCENDDTEKMIIDVTGKKDDLQKIIDLKIIEGVYLQLLLKETT